jgi:hypothetical protein|tara:strand:- start:353 stop:565 length:213 start_codon:yes stop_codon:yes gene_type:complete
MSWNLIPWSEQTTNIMATMTYAQLIEKLQQLDEKQLKKNVAIYDEHLNEKCLVHNELIFFDNNQFPYLKI